MGREIVTQTNGVQGSTNYGPREVTKELPAGNKGAGRVKELFVHLDGNNPMAYKANDEAAIAWQAGGYVIEVLAYAVTAIAAVGGVDMATVKHSDGTAGGPALAGVLASAAAGTWERAAIDLPVGVDDLQLTVALGLAANEEAILIYRYLDAPV